jgi:hypothetical protein
MACVRGVATGALIREGSMKRFTLSLALFASSLFILFYAAPAEAQATRTWISGVGDDANPCSRTAPCKTFAGAISKTAINGEINCLDPGGFGAVTIVKSITLDCHEIYASILNSGTNGINIPFDSFAAADTRKTVRIRNLNFNGADTGVIGIRITGGAVIQKGVVIVEDTLIDGNFGGSARGISDERTQGGELYIANTTVRNTGQTGIVIIGPGRVDAALHNVRVENSNAGIAVSGGGKVMINNSIFVGNAAVGVESDGTTAVSLSNSVVSNNGIGVQNGGGTPVIRMHNNDISFNTTAFSGATQSYLTNRVAGNTGLGTAPTQIGSTTNPTGLQ